ncbi:ryanodine receptor 1-like [Perca fluviatilis]|uniref:ryanodine receptor 1-like n=1 Tax=Perca fluviatilis TaxID=8168 RepID=UPI0019652498|nr:ryanodine receptor 1-like [Perca fluviatilis]
MAEGADGEEEIQFLRTDDQVVLQCTASILKEQIKLCLSCEGFGNRLCFLETTSNAQIVPPDLAICCFILEQSLSVRALQEMLSNSSVDEAVDLDKWERPAGGPSILPLSKGLKARRSGWEMTSFLSAFLQSDTW